MHRLLVVALGAFVTFCAFAGPPSTEPIDKDVTRLVELFSDGLAESYPEFRQVRFGKIFGSDREDAVAVFSIEGFGGGNYHAEYLAFFESVEPYQIEEHAPRPFRLVAVTQVGGRMWRTFDWETLKLGSGYVRMSGEKWGPSDPGCCPSVPVSATFHVKEGYILETK